MPDDPLDPEFTLPSATPLGPQAPHHGPLQIDVGPGGPGGPGIHGGAGPFRMPAREPARISERTETALEQPAGFEPHMIGQRLPSEASRPTQPQPRLVDIETMRATPAAKGKAPFLNRAIDLFKQYPGTPPPWHNLPPEEQVARQVEQMKNNLLWLYDRTPAAWRDRAMKWYEGGNKIISDQAQQYQLSPRATAGVTAALSPQKDWFENVSMAQRVLLDPQVRGTPMTPEMVEKFKAFNKPGWGALYNQIAGKSYDQLAAETANAPPGVGATLKSLWVRLYDEAHMPQSFRVVSPEGEFGELVMTDAGAPAKLRWGSLADISKAIRMIETNGAEAETLMGEKHKVRSFYNNLLVPNSPRGDVTMDTHATAAALLRPLAAEDLEVAHNFENWPGPGQPSAPGSDVTGMRGTYGIYADAYRLAAAERGILPRQMQSVTWEAIRGLYPRTFKKAANKQIIDTLWRRYANGQATIEQTRDALWHAAGGIDTPAWAAGSDRGNADPFRYSGDPRELFEPRVYAEPAGYPFVGRGDEPTAAAAPSDEVSAALGAGAQ